MAALGHRQTTTTIGNAITDTAAASTSQGCAVGSRPVFSKQEFSKKGWPHQEVSRHGPHTEHRSRIGYSKSVAENGRQYTYFLPLKIAMQIKHWPAVPCLAWRWLCQISTACVKAATRGSIVALRPALARPRQSPQRAPSRAWWLTRQ